MEGGKDSSLCRIQHKLESLPATNMMWMGSEHGSWHGSDQAEWAGVAGPNGLFRLLARRFPVFSPCVALC